MRKRASTARILTGGLLLLAIFTLGTVPAFAATQQQSGSIGLEGTIPSNPPAQAPTIDIPGNGQNFSSLPITVAGRCTSGLLVEIFKNNVFAGSITCTGGSYSLKIDLFSGKNDLLARQYDALNQVSPDSAVVSVNFNDGLPSTGPRISLTTLFAKRGADPNTTLSWPLTLSGGTAPYAISVDWGDKSAPDLISRAASGDFDIEHTCGASGIYNITVKATDANGFTAFLQFVGVCNGPIQQATTKSTNNTIVTKTVLGPAFWIASCLAIPLLFSAFWLGRKHQLQIIRDRLHRGERPL